VVTKQDVWLNKTPKPIRKTNKEIDFLIEKENGKLDFMWAKVRLSLLPGIT